MTTWEGKAKPVAATWAAVQDQWLTAITDFEGEGHPSFLFVGCSVRRALQHSAPVWPMLHECCIALLLKLRRAPHSALKSGTRRCCADRSVVHLLWLLYGCLQQTILRWRSGGMLCSTAPLVPCTGLPSWTLSPLLLRPGQKLPSGWHSTSPPS